MLDAVYLQQNSFDLVDANCGTERQRYVTDKLIYVLGSEHALDNKDDARSFFNRMRQKFIDWNYTEFESDAYVKNHRFSAFGREARWFLWLYFVISRA